VQLTASIVQDDRGTVRPLTDGHDSAIAKGGHADEIGEPFGYHVSTVRYSQPNLYPIQRESNTVAAVFSLESSSGAQGARSNLTGQQITNVVFVAAICRRLRTVPCGKTGDGIHSAWQIERSSPRDLYR
jgi:hypothetical protein